MPVFMTFIERTSLRAGLFALRDPARTTYMLERNDRGSTEMPKQPEKAEGDETIRRRILEAAARALAEAEARRKAAEVAAERPREIDGRGGPDPARYGDWEVKGIATDF